MGLPGMRCLIRCAYVAVAICGLNGPALASTPDEQLVERVEAALHSDRYFYDKHITVSVEGGRVALRGFVASDWDLLHAIRVANKAANGRQVLNYLTIEIGGLK
jgi:osmotically-inducible protein OsmY